MTTRPIGYQITYTCCLRCAPEGVRDHYEPLRESDEHGIAYYCDDCGRRLMPAEDIPAPSRR